MYEYRGFVPRENDVRATWQVASPERKAEAKPVKQGPDPPLRPGILAFDAAHVPASLLLRQSIHRLYQGFRGFADILHI